MTGCPAVSAHKTPGITLLDALGSDAMAISRLIDHSVRTGCAVDHRNDPQLLNTWLRSSSPARLLRLLDQGHIHARLALMHSRPVGVALAHADGEILHCYVLSEFSRRGVGTALMSELEEQLLERGCVTACLSSNLTGQGFYRHLGYREVGQPLRMGGLTLTPMEKSLVRPAMGEWVERLSHRLVGG
ncbi:GNAT family N-acetyltransferase [Pseudomonas sp. HR96]|uniref:GNAT family N-acetyltransferase n=1 Tax=Pseudomonas sp. HR96 TaxID=1027966 RepID=UPI002A749958|nr:GNAT family N-acetyltransferase [Pseudomonas sp. HR96]WPP01453.1 GNAT family N-acetyltransferase [Pseudomonas sp. HR96]